MSKSQNDQADKSKEYALLYDAFNNGMIDLSTMRESVEVIERSKVLDKHYANFKTWIDSEDRYNTNVPDPTKSGGRRRLRRKTLAELEDAIVACYKELEENPTIGELFERWVSEKLEEKEIQKQTYDKYHTCYLRFFVNGPEPLDKIKIKSITEPMLRHFIKTTHYHLKLGKKGYGDLRMLVNGIFKYALDYELTHISISYLIQDLQINPGKYEKKKRDASDHIYLEDEVPEIMKYLEEDGGIHSLGLLLMFYTGLRVGELSALTFEDVHSEKLKNSDIIKNSIYVGKTEIKVRDDAGKWIKIVGDTTKTSAGTRNVIINNKAIEIIDKIRELNPNGTYMFMYNGKRIKGHAFNKKMERVCNSLGIKYRSVHKIRATYITNLIENNVSESLITEMVGHTSIQTTKGYYYFSNQSDPNKVNQMVAAVNYG